MNQSDTFARFAGTEAVRQDLKSKSVRGAMYMAIGGAGDFFVRLASIIILARLVIPEHFGLVGMVTAVTGIAGQVSHLGLSTATVQRREIEHQQVTNLFWINVAFGALLSLVIFALAPLVAAFYRDPRLIPITMVLSISFLWMGLTVQHEALLTRQMKQAQTSLIRLGATFLGTGLAVVLAILGYGYWALVWQEIARSCLVAIGVWVCCRWVPGLPSRSAKVGSLLRFGGHLTLAQLLNALISNLDRFLIGRFFGAEPLGLYRQAQQLIMTPIEQLNTPLQSVSQPALSMLQDDHDRYRRYYRKIVHIVGLATMPLAAFAAVYAVEITLVVLGKKWIDAAPLLMIFSLAAFIRPVLGTNGVVLITCGRSKRLLVFALVRNATLVVLTFAAIRWGAEGIAVGQLATTVVLTLPCLYYSFAQSPVTVGTFFNAIRTPLIASAVMVATLTLFRSFMPEIGHLTALCSGLGVAAAAYLGVCLLLPESRQELNTLLKALQASLSLRRLQSRRRYANDSQNPIQLLNRAG